MNKKSNRWHMEAVKKKKKINEDGEEIVGTIEGLHLIFKTMTVE